LVNLAEETFGHLWQRRLSRAVSALWDDPGAVFPEAAGQSSEPSWYITERVVAALVAARSVFGQTRPASAGLMELATDLLSEADHLFSAELLNGPAAPALRTTLQRIEARLERARAILAERPGTAYALAIEVLNELDQLSAARADAIGNI
jgi:hypothetical protein